MNKTAIKTFATWARNKLITDITYKAGLMGVSCDGIAEPLPQSTKEIQFFDIGASEPYAISNIEIAQRNKLVEIIKTKAASSDYKNAYRYVVEEVAYTWFNRLIAIRFMEVNDYLPSRIRVLSSESPNKPEPDLVTTPFDADFPFTSAERERVLEFKLDNKLDDLFQMLFIKQCNALHEILPELFEKTNDYTELLLNITYSDKDGVVSRLINNIAEEDFQNQVQIIGWLYQYYNTEPKEDTFNLLKKNVKVTKERIPTATQLFTPDWIVRYMVENSLGRLWLEQERARVGLGNEYLNGSYFGWKYYLEEAEQEPSVQKKMDLRLKEQKYLRPEEIKIIDPCMGSGHILVYAFDVLIQIYESQGYSARDAAKLILQHNIFGLDIDKRAWQLAYFSLIMKARQYNRRIFNEQVAPQLYFPSGDAEGEEIGSLIKVDVLEPMPQISEGQMTIEDINYAEKLSIWDFKRVLSQHYDIVITNPPYMGSSGMNNRLSEFLKLNYPDSKSDLFAVFIEKCTSMVAPQGYSCLVTMQSWMFLSSYENLRYKLLSNNTITNLMHMENMVMGIAFGTAVTILKNVYVRDYKGTYNYIKLLDIDDDEPIVFPVVKNRFSQVSANIFAKIPGMPIAYWISNNLLKVFEEGSKMSELIEPKQGLATADNNRFLRLWWEPSNNKIKYDTNSIEESKASGFKWVPYNKGGERRQWYGNYDYVVNWENDGFEIRNFKDNKGKQRSAVRSPQFYFKEAITWSDITSGGFSIRYRTAGSIHDVTGMSAFTENRMLLLYLLGLMSTKIADYVFKILNPTIHLQIGNFSNFPVLSQNQISERVILIIEECIRLSQNDWDSFENSWEFPYHPLIKGANQGTDKDTQNKIQLCYEQWKSITESRFLQLKENEEELNRVFIDIYGLQSELTPEVGDKEVTIARIFDNKEDIPESMKGNKYVLTKTDVIKSFVSYAVGCMFGRYSLDVDGLAYAGGEWDDSQYRTFIPDKDNILPITDEQYYEDDIVGLFVAFVKKVYGQETLEENLAFIAEALGNKGNSSREKIRNYFLKDFFKEHCKTYQKRPIYWLFDSGKQDGFKALIYMHRYDENTIGNLRIDYLHRLQRVYEREIARMDETIKHSDNAREKSVAEKRKEKLMKQLKETKDYDEKIAHLAIARRFIDLDDGVKVNYEKVQTDLENTMLPVLAKI
ncbi:BREX-1 system adenine-specific DNA-methyltransferase PglX [Paenibacillus sp. MER TA 81-3]|uniref:BREX-1 system adenine-specific DNA-methyltransferase PglX n=1 Tax=Paenibacillus sp. MER TA 81-3 TaxID=2939573 RepID=UPI00203C3603|nr:BREX-1 system adenine-specific DNA-methyltransferase PglX [Paenibacillus sp. MER TA 81-3]MCM3342061.1 BREX-1 system adenine-specific DNA-methyltransferase PglX [Paenibacillus sp. MER TA 81-3]